MLATPPGWADALARSHTVRTRLDVLVNGRLVESFDAESDTGIISGQVTVDGNATHRRTLTTVLVDPTGRVLPRRIGDLLSPPNELAVWQGIDGFSLLPVGVFGISAPQVEDRDGQLPITLTGQDRSRRIRRRSWTDTHIIERGMGVGPAIAGILADRDPTGPALVVTEPTAATTPTLVLGEDGKIDPWADATDLATANGLELFYDPAGVPVLRPVRDPAQGADATYAEGDGGLLLSGQRGFSDEPGFNGVVVVGEGSDIAEAFRVELWDTEPSSPTYYDPALPGLSRWGPVPKRITSDLILTAQQGLLTARAELQGALGTVEQVSFSGVPNAALDAGDILGLRRERLALSARYVLDAFGLPLGPGAMTGTCRSRRVA